MAESASVQVRVPRLADEGMRHEGKGKSPVTETETETETETWTLNASISHETIFLLSSIYFYSSILLHLITGRAHDLSFDQPTTTTNCW